MSPHHISAVRERLGYATDNDLVACVHKGIPLDKKIEDSL